MSSTEYVTFNIGGQTFGTSVLEVHDVFKAVSITPVPMARPEIAGVLNLRGRIVTAIDARARLGLQRKTGIRKNAMAIGVERNGESFGLIIDSVGEVMRLEDADLEQNPVNLDPVWASVSKGVHKLGDKLLIAMDIDRMLRLDSGDDLAAA
ncbi:MAG: chemotaxis protein CheW [Hirschia sp.]|mgnify:CR=1 FL=1|nr:chemotaxis protein CheW [Hirschia sp.]MBF18983.1 chemotaxis protein CheW [Hirschia sp.]|tara:strand:+ start:394 stop:846 length:453 start_codon:yes stop_codon:yes gene_type:complete